MAEASILSVIATVGSRLSDLTIKDGQLIFVRDMHRIALDLEGERVFYNEINELATETARAALRDPVNGAFYFVVETAVMWTYRNKWVRITAPPQEIVSIGATLPSLGDASTLYVDTAKKEISVWNAEAEAYDVVADKTEEMSADEVAALFLT